MDRRARAGDRRSHSGPGGPLGGGGQRHHDAVAHRRRGRGRIRGPLLPEAASDPARRGARGRPALHGVRRPVSQSVLLGRLCAQWGGGLGPRRAIGVGPMRTEFNGQFVRASRSPKEQTMNRAPIGQMVRATLLWAGVGAFLGCTGTGESPAAPDGLLSAAKVSSGPSVTAADPPYGHEGDVSKTVTITGSGFAAGAQAAWERNGVIDPKIQVLSTQYVSSTQLVTTITIASDASIDLYDVSVTNSDRKKGIGYALFEVTQAVAITGTEIAYSANSNGALTGRVGNPGAFHFSLSSALDTLGGFGRGFDISEDGLAVVGGISDR